MADDDYFSDDDLGDLGEDVFQALDNQAAHQASQRQQALQSQLSQREVVKPPWSGRAGVSKEDAEARALYLERQRERQESQHYVKLQQQNQLRHSQASRQQSQFTHQQRQLQPRQTYQPTHSNYITLPTLPDPQAQQQYTTADENTTLGGLAAQVANSDDYGGFDEAYLELLDTAGPTAIVKQRANGGNDNTMVQDSYAQNPQYRQQQQQYNGEYDQYAEEVVMQDADAVEGYEQQNQMGPDVTEELNQMRQMVQQLLAEKENLAKTNHDLQARVYTKAGETAILRSKLDKEAKEHERVVTSLSALQTEKEEQHKRMVDGLQNEVEKMKTNNVFLQRDLKEVVTKNKSLEKGRKASITLPKNENSAIKDITTTPRKNRSYALRDGFDDVDLDWGSPKKSGGLMTKGSPSKAAGKRKRKIDDSPVSTFALQLPLSQARVSPPLQRQESDIEERIVQEIDDKLIDKLTHKDDRFEYFRALTIYRTSSSSHPVLELLSQYRFPSSGDITIFSIFFDKVTTVQNAPAESQFPASICKILLSLWERCLTEKFLSPLSLILDILHYAMTWSLSNSIYAIILDDLIFLIQRTLGTPAKDDLDAVIVPETIFAPCFRLFYRLSLGVLASERLSKRLWRHVEIHLPIKFLSARTQSIYHVRYMLGILCTSSRCESFGPISNTASDVDQRRDETKLIDFIGNLMLQDPLFEPTISEGAKRLQLLEMRLDICNFIGCIVITKPALENLQNNFTFAARLVRRIAEEIDEAYTHRYGIEQSVQFINAGMRILRGILGNQDLMSGSHETGPAYLVAMTRLAFLEDGSHLKDLGVADDVIDAAREILENTLTMDEAERLGAMFQHV